MTVRTRGALVIGCLATAAAIAVVTHEHFRSARTQPAALPAQSARAGTTPSAARPTLWLLSIGVSHYKQSDIALQFADADARAVAELLEGQGKGPIYSETKTRVLTNEQVTRESILAGIERFLGQAGPHDVAVIFMAGHGVQDRATGSYYFLPYPANAENLLTEGLRMSDFDEMMRVLRRNVRRVVIMLDTCHAGALQLASRAMTSADDLAAQVSVAEGLFLLAATKPGEESKEKPELGHGVFTYALLEGLRGAADSSGNGLVSVSDLFGYVARRVPRLTDGRQHPYHKIEGTDLTFAAVEHEPKPAEPIPSVQEMAENPPELAVTPIANTIGVMQFHNLRADAEHNWVADALRTALNTELSKVRLLHLYSPELIDRARKTRGADDLMTARQLGLSKLVSGSFVVVGDSLRIDVRIVDAATGMQEGSDSAQGQLADFFDLEKKLVLSILRRLPVTVSVAEDKSITERTNTSVNAYRLLLEAEGLAGEPTPSRATPSGPRVRGPVSEPHSRLENRTEGRGLRTADRTEAQGLRTEWGTETNGERAQRSVLSPQSSALFFQSFLSVAQSSVLFPQSFFSVAHAAEPPADTKAEVLRSLEEYRRALENKDVDRLASLYVSLSPRQREALRAYLENAGNLKVEIADVSVEPHGQEVTVSYTRRDSFVDKQSGKPARLEVRLTKTLVHEGTTWKIGGGA